MNLPDDGLIVCPEDRRGESLNAERRKRDIVRQHADQNMIDDGDLRGRAERGIVGARGRYRDWIRGWSRSGSSKVHLQCRAAREILAGAGANYADLARGRVPTGYSVHAPVQVSG